THPSHDTVAASPQGTELPHWERLTEPDVEAPAWHASVSQAVVEALSTDVTRGLSDEGVSQRRELFGDNLLQLGREEPAILRFLRQFHQPLIYVLLVATLVTLVLGEWLDASVIASVV